LVFHPFLQRFAHGDHASLGVGLQIPGLKRYQQTAKDLSINEPNAVLVNRLNPEDMLTTK
jgi:hypothetical protein